MKVRMLTSVAGIDDKGKVFCFEANEEYDLPPKQARDFCAIPHDMPRAEPVAEREVDRAEKRG